MSKTTTLANKADFDVFIKKPSLAVVHFGAEWADVCSQLDSILVELKDELKSFDCARIDAEGVAEVSLAYNVKAAPTVVIFKAGKEVDRVNGFNPAEMKSAILKLMIDEGVPSHSTKNVPDGKEELDKRLASLINKSRLMIFIKGEPNAPKCGFTRQLLELLKDLKADFSSFDILSDEQVRQGLKEYSKWPTYPQIYLDGELLGGLDVFREEISDKSFVEKLPKISS